MTATTVDRGTVPADRPGDHLVPLPDGGWHVWRQLALRGTGFPADQVLRLAAPASAAAADRLGDARLQAAAAREAALEALRGELDALRGAGLWDDLGRRRPLLRAISRLNKGRSAGEEYAGRPESVRLSEAEEQLRAATVELAAVFADEMELLSKELRDTADDPRFQEAVIWQNRQAYESGVRRLAKGSGSGRRNSRQREHEALVAGYLQRYCVKNDSIGFFGPVGWAEIAPSGPALSARPGPGLIDSRQVYFEQWGLDALARSLGHDDSLRRWLPPRRLPSAALEGSTLRLPGRTLELPAAKAAVLGAVLRLCDGSRTALEVVAELGIGSEADGLALLESARAAGLLAWDLDLPLRPRPEQRLREALEAVGDPGLRADALARLDRLEAARDEVTAAAGSPTALYQAFEALEQTFTELTGAAPTRAHGETYGARTLVYEDCRRDVEVALGPELMAELGGPLSLMLDSARWLTHAVAESYRAYFLRIHRELTAGDPGRELRLPQFWQALQSELLGPGATLVEQALAEFQRRWAQVLGPLEGRRVELRSSDLRPLVDREFAAPGPGWQGARYQCPDLMIAAASAEAVAAGDYQLVMGELHVGANTLRNLLFVDQHPQPEELFRMTGLDLPQPRVIPRLPKHWLYATRTMTVLESERDYRLLLGDDHSWSLRDPRALIGAELAVELRDGAVVARVPGGGPEFDMVELLGEALSFKVLGRFQVLAPRRHSPRVTVDRLVVCRESWRFRADELSFAHEPDEALRFAAVREWARGLGMPRFVFVKAAHESKPFYVDLDSPLFVNAFAHAVRGAPADVDGRLPIVVGEMLPTSEQAWLTDDQGMSYTSELRMVAVDR